ncbi:MAG: hypothetical protein QE271_02265 [Bacteriovoracaceae bacterium]|nr:hypothetical protein [Bacteriovoracaceae bacterium]
MGKYFLVLFIMVAIGVLINHYLVLMNKGKWQKTVNIQRTFLNFKRSELYADNNIKNRYTDYRVETPKEYRIPNSHPLAPRKSPPPASSPINENSELDVKFLEGYKVDDDHDDPKTLEVSDATASNSEIQIAPAEFSSFHGDKKNSHRHNHPHIPKNKSAEKSPNPKTSTRKTNAKNR